MNPSSSSSVISRDQALSVFNHPFPQSHSSPLPNLKNGSFVSPTINTHTRKPKSHTSFTAPKRLQVITGCLGERSSPARTLRQILESPGVHQGPACFDGLSAKLVERAGFRYCFTSGFSISAARLGLPDTGFISYGEMVDQGQQITQAVSIPVIGDGDNGYGNAMNVKRTVKGYIRAGFAGIILEDQVSPKACGHKQGRKVVSREEAIMRIKAAVDARSSNVDL
ncbi:2,3-dimethylmalate lyase-like [Hibiscus syriacus]|uniref:2,3-dimethylmalate lyase-like n=1 Tax=Hibiscus syriacus TaxID=106335 RepID=UPI001920AE85|nr:2,3-dimethylmalate lyase-like [Hibiscus syriacus]